MTEHDDHFTRVYWRNTVRLLGCLAFVGSVVVLVALAIGWLAHR